MDVGQSRSFSEYLTLGASGPPQSLNGTLQSGALDRTKVTRAMFLLEVGAMTGGSTIDMKLQESTTGVGSWTDVSPATAITQLASAGGNNRRASIEVDVNWNQLTKQFLSVLVTVANAASLVSVSAIGFNETRMATTTDDASVAQRKVAPALIPVPVN